MRGLAFNANLADFRGQNEPISLQEVKIRSLEANNLAEPARVRRSRIRIALSHKSRTP